MKIKIPQKFIPLDKSWIIRMGILDITYGFDDIKKFLNTENNLGEDLLALKRAVILWKTNKYINVGESATLYRFLKFTSWKLNLNKKFIIKGTLLKRKITDDQIIINYPIKKLLQLDNGTSQWASAAALLGNKERIKNPSYKLGVTYKAIKHWNNQRKIYNSWISKYDFTILKQAETFIKFKKQLRPKFTAKQAEDYCFARIFNFITKKEGEKRWPALRNHESDRIIEMENMISKANKGFNINSKDHRIIQAIAMWAEINNKKLKFKYPNAVNKSWPQFWEFIEWSKNINSIQ